LSAETDYLAAITKMAAVCTMVAVSPAGELVMVAGNLGIRALEKRTDDCRKVRALGIAGNVLLGLLAACLTPISWMGAVSLAVVNWWVFHLGVDLLVTEQSESPR